MQVLHHAALGFTLRKLSEAARHRVWIISPYIGRWPAIKSLLGSNWWLGSTVDLRIITDTSDPRNVYHATLLKLLDRGSVRSIPGIHAKLYLVEPG